MLKNIKIPEKFYSRKLSDIGIIGRAIIILIIPLIFTWLMFDPLATIDLESNTNKAQYIPKIEMDKKLTKFIIAEFFQTSLHLGWYKVCFENRGALSINGHIIVNREDRGDIQLLVKEISAPPFENEYRALTAKPFGPPDCLRFNSSNNGLIVGSSTVSLGAWINDGPEDINILTPTMFQFTYDFEKMSLYIKQDFIAFTTKYIIILLIWASLILLISSLKEWLIKRGI